MEIVETDSLIKKLIGIWPRGLQVSTRNGILNSTKCIYVNSDSVFVFDISTEFIFDKQYGLNIENFGIKYDGYKWQIEQTIS